MTHFKPYTKRFFFLHGQTKDEFYTSDLKVANLEEILHKHLQKNGYERIVYYQGQSKGVRCYDEKSYRLSFIEKNDEQKASRVRHQNNKVLSGVLGKRMARKATAKEEKFDATKPLSKINMGDSEIVRHFDTLVSDATIQTAIIFSNFNDFILHTEHDVVRNLSSKIDDWDGLPSLNKNIVIFIIPSNISPGRIKQNMDKYDQWQTLAAKMFESTDDDKIKTTDHMIRIIYPYKDEIQNLVNYLRINNGVNVDWLHFDENIELLVKISKEKGISLKEFAAQLQNINSFSKENIYKLFEIKPEKKGLEKLQEMKGLEYLTLEIKKIVKYANSKKVVIQESNTDEVKRILPQLQKHKNEVNLHISLTGNPGTGKTTVAKIISEIFKEEGILEVGHIVEAKSSDLVGEYIGHTAVKTQDKIDQAIGGVLFIDEAYKLLKNKFGHEAIDTIVEAMTARDGEFSIIIAGYPKEIAEFINSNPGLSRRFANKIHLKDYEPEVLIDIFENKMKRDNYSFDSELEDIFPHFIRNWFDARDEKTFGNAGDVLNLLTDMSKNALFDDRKILQILDIPESLESGDKDNKHSYQMRDFLKKQSDDVMADALAKLDDIVGLESVKENVKSIIASIKMNKLRNPDAKVVAGHYIFKGNPGTGKTTVARIFGEILKELKVLKKGHFIEVGKKDLVEDHVGGTVKKTGKVLESALGGILFIDEAYSLSSGGEKDYGQEAINSIVPFMENNKNNFTLIVAGYNKNMDEFLDANIGLNRRFGNTIVFEDYSNEEMLSIFKIFVEKDGFSLGYGVDDKLIEIFQNIREHSKHFGNGGDAENVFNRAKSSLDKRLNKLDDLVSDDPRLNSIELEDLY